MIWGFCVYFVYMIPLETGVLRKHRFQKSQINSYILTLSLSLFSVVIIYFKAAVSTYVQVIPKSWHRLYFPRT